MLLCENIFHTGSAKRFFNGVKMSININIEKLKKDITSEDILASLFYYAVFGEKISENDLERFNPDYAIGKFQSKQTYYKI